MAENKSPIPIRNLFYMLCYAWNVLAVKDDIKVGTDDFDDAYNLLGRVFSYGVGKLIRSGFHRSYIEREEELSTLRGKIMVQESINRMSWQNKTLVCSYDEYSTNDTFNQILKYTMEALISNPNVDKGTRRELKKQIVFFSRIDATAPTKVARQKLVFNRNNVTYKLLINIAVMLYENTIVNEDDGNSVFKDFFRDEQMHKVFELFILNFYRIHLDKKTYRVHAPKISWKLEEGEVVDAWSAFFDIDDNPGDRRTDIVVENKEEKLQFIFDAKYYKETFVKAYMNDADERARTSHLNQLRGYLLDSDFDGKRIGALIYPMVNNDLKTGRLHPIQGTPMLIKTINLNVEWREIEDDLLDFLDRLERVNKS